MYNMHFAVLLLWLYGSCVWVMHLAHFCFQGSDDDDSSISWGSDSTVSSESEEEGEAREYDASMFLKKWVILNLHEHEKHVRLKNSTYLWRMKR